MRAAVLSHYAKKGTEITIKEIPTSVPEENEVLVKLMAALKRQTYDFLFVHEDGSLLDSIGRIFEKNFHWKHLAAFKRFLTP